MEGQAEGHLLALALQRLALRLPHDWSVTFTSRGELHLWDESGTERFEGARAIGLLVRMLAGERIEWETIGTPTDVRIPIR